MRYNYAYRLTWPVATVGANLCLKSLQERNCKESKIKHLIERKSCVHGRFVVLCIDHINVPGSGLSTHAHDS